MRLFAMTLLGVVLTSCSQSGGTPPASAIANGGAPALSIVRASSPYEVLHAFAGGTSDGATPYGGLLALNGRLYGTTGDGGTADDGTIFSMTPSGGETVLSSFGGTTALDGRAPVVDLIAMNGALYGTTNYGGAANDGTVFTASTSGDEHPLYSFKGGADAATPQAALVNLNSEFYGISANGGVAGLGTVYKISATGKEAVVHTFHGADGSDPTAGLIALDGVLYGTTFEGGANGVGCVFAVRPSGTLRVIYSFGNIPDAENPVAGLLALNGKLYGTTQNGGSSGNGAVFELSASGKETVLYSFKGFPDGAEPQGGLIAYKGQLYGTTIFGGGTGNDGTAFKISTAGAETILHVFSGGSDGRGPYATLTALNGELYGTTEAGGASDLGTVYKLAP